MGCGSFLIVLLLSAGVLSVTVGSQTTLMLEVEPGDNVTLCCRNSATEPAYIYWLKHTNTSVPDLLTCLNYKLLSSSSPCHFAPQTNRMAMSVNSNITSLTITGVNYTDSGLYYCCIQRSTFITFSNATLLLVQEFNETLSRNRFQASCSSEVFFILTVVLSAVVVILISALLLVLKNRKPCRDDGGSKVKEEKEEQDGEMVDYAALKFTKKKNKRTGTHFEDPRIVYSSVRF